MLAIWKIVAGFGLLTVGGVLAIPGVPGPGLPIMLLGLLLLSERFAWARKGLAWGKERFARMRRGDVEKRPIDGNGNRSALTTMKK
jgi:hypothetical protein